MAIGDGINDFLMLNESDIGVSMVSSNKAHQYIDGDYNSLN